MNYITDDYDDYSCARHRTDEEPCPKCKAEQVARQQAAHKQSVERQQSRLKVMDRSNVIPRRKR
jgi:hypothetical protein